MAAAAASKTERKSTGSAPPAKKSRKVVKKADSDSDASSGGEQDEASTPSAAASDSEDDDEEDVKPKKKSARGKATTKKAAGKKEKNGTKGKAKAVKGKKRKSKGDSDDSDESEYAASNASDEDEDDHDFESDESDGGVRTRVVRDVQKKLPAPKENAETPIILPTTLDFLARLVKNNDREWFKARDAEYRHALLNFNTFIKAWIPLASEADWQLPHLPAKDVVHWIYRDVRFSKDKTPYKTYLCANHSRTGRKGPFAGYYLQIAPKDRSFLACGTWSPGTNELKAIRDEILRDPSPLRKVLAEPDFVELYGSDKPRMDGKRTSIFGHSDQLKNAPKLPGVDKTHKDIDLLKCRSFAIETKFTDEQVLSEDFLLRIKKAMDVAVPFVHLLNEMIMPTPPSEDEAAGGENGDGENSAGESGSEGDEEEE
ncbi:hypothetical protein JCM10908_000600 [Rhodotorula pacifica]|uniref:DUF2461 domain-containing protein n=1 Tax=Rhodotorula pacifica TaxID=1495444 RepID=UPI00317F2693